PRRARSRLQAHFSDAAPADAKRTRTVEVTPHPSARKADAALLFNTVVWGSTFVLVKAALSDISPILFLALRFSIAAAALLILFRPGRRQWSRAAAGAGSLAGAFLFSGYALQTVGLRFTSAPKSAFLTGLTSVMVPLLGALVYKTRPRVSE